MTATEHPAAMSMRSQLLTGYGRLEPTRAEVPRRDRLADGDVYLRVRAGGLCGSDLPYFRTGSAKEGVPTPGYPMHEVVGEVLESRDPAIHRGQLVVGWARDFDAMSEFIVASADELCPYTATVEPQHAIVLQPLACVIYALDQLRRVQGGRAVVFGMGPIGALFVWLLRRRGAAHISVVDPVDRTAEARRFGADECIVATAGDWVAAEEPREGADVVIDAAGHQDGLISSAVNVAARSAEIYAFGLPEPAIQEVPLDAFLRKNLTLASGVTLDRARALAIADRYLSDAPELATALVTHRWAFDDAQEAYEAACTPRPGQLKIVLSDDATT